MERYHWTLLATKLANTSGLSPVQLQKALFLLAKGMPNAVGSDFYTFIPHNYGPFSRDIYEDATRLARENLVAITSEGRYPQYRCTPAGEGIAKMMLPTADPKAVEYLDNIVTWVQRQTFAGLVSSIYRKFPEYRVNSVFSEQFQP